MNTEQEKWYVVLGMLKLGGNFVKRLAKTIQAADPTNLELIKNTWPEYWEKYLELGINISEESENNV